MIGAMTFTNWARQATFTRSAWRRKVISMLPTKRASSKLYTSSRMGSAWPHLFARVTSSVCWLEWYHTFHSSKERLTAFLACFLPFTLSQMHTTVWMNSSKSMLRARKPGVSFVGLP